MVDVWQGNADQLHQVGDQMASQIAKAVNSAKLSSIPVPGLGDEATAYALSSEVLNAGSIFVRKGGYAIYLVDEVTGGPAPTTAALTGTARTALGRLP
jgi:hypothetical protein